MRIDNQQQQNKGVMDLMPQTGAVEEKNGRLNLSGQHKRLKFGVNFGGRKKRDTVVCGCGKDGEQ